MISLVSWLRLPLFLIGLLLVFTAERYLTDATQTRTLIAGWIVSVLGFALGVLAHAKARDTDEASLKAGWIQVFAWQILIMLGMGLYHLHSYLSVDNFPTPRLILLGAWFSAVVLGLFWGLGVEWAIVRSNRGFFAETQRIWACARALLSLGLLLLGLIGINFFLAKKDKVYDLSYFKTTKPGESTLKILRQVQVDVRIGAFFSKDSEVAPFVRTYLQEAVAGSAKIKLEFYDKDVNPRQAEEFRVSRDGQIVFLVNDKRQRIELGDKLEDARKKLQSLDSLFQKTFLLSIEEAKPIYFLQSHGEFNWDTNAQDELRSLRRLETLIRNQNMWPRKLETAFKDIPNDAVAVAIIGPVTSITDKEVESLRNYLNQGGHLLIALDLDKGDEKIQDLLGTDQQALGKLLAEVGLAYNPKLLVNDRDFVANSREKIDHYFLYTNVFGSHASVKTLSRNDQKLQVMTYRSGVIVETPEAEKSGWDLAGTIYSMSNSFLDQVENLEFDAAKEKRESHVMAVAAEKAAGNGKMSKLLLFADASAFADPLMQSPGNQWAALDGVRWLMDREDQMGAVGSEEDVFIQHSNMRELWVFHGSIYLIPLAVLLVGFVMNRKKRKAEKA